VIHHDERDLPSLAGPEADEASGHRRLDEVPCQARSRLLYPPTPVPPVPCPCTDLLVETVRKLSASERAVLEGSEDHRGRFLLLETRPVDPSPMVQQPGRHQTANDVEEVARPMQVQRPAQGPRLDDRSLRVQGPSHVIDREPFDPGPQGDPSHHGYLGLDPTGIADDRRKPVTSRPNVQVVPLQSEGGDLVAAKRQKLEYLGHVFRQERSSIASPRPVGAGSRRRARRCRKGNRP